MGGEWTSPLRCQPCWVQSSSCVRRLRLTKTLSSRFKCKTEKIHTSEYDGMFTYFKRVWQTILSHQFSICQERVRRLFITLLRGAILHVLRHFFAVHFYKFRVPEFTLSSSNISVCTCFQQFVSPSLHEQCCSWRVYSKNMTDFISYLCEITSLFLLDFFTKNLDKCINFLITVFTRVHTIKPQFYPKC